MCRLDSCVQDSDKLTGTSKAGKMDTIRADQRDAGREGRGDKQALIINPATPRYAATGIRQGWLGGRGRRRAGRGGSGTRWSTCANSDS